MASSASLLVTSALPYANGPLHLGHLVEHIQTDIWIRTQRLLGKSCLSICGIDAHGTAIMLKAEKEGLTPEALTESIQASHKKDFDAFSIHYDSYYTTHAQENQSLTESIYKKLQTKNAITEKKIQQAYDPVKHIFLPDRYVKGTCPKCKTADQYGDNCEACGATYNPTDLINPLSTLSGTAPIEKETTHYFFNLPLYASFLETWTQSGVLQVEAANKLKEWFAQGLMPWDISRDAPYFGFLIPGTTDKYFYVWLDAPIGYMASFQHYAAQHAIDFDTYWGKDAKTELYHFIGKDILYFHALFWPAVLHSAEYRLPTAIFAHGFLTINGQKMSKSRGTFIEAGAYLEHLDPAYLRYYFAAKLNGRIEDIDLNFDDFTNKINADLVGKVVNIASRSASFIHKYFEGNVSDTLPEHPLYHTILKAKESIVEAYLNRDYAAAIRLIMDCATLVNQYIDAEKPWVLAKEETALPKVQAICTLALNAFRLIMAYLKPVLPEMAQATEALLQCEALTFNNLDTPVIKKRIATFQPLMQRVDPKAIQALMESPAL